LIEYVAVTCQIRDVKNVKGFGYQRQRERLFKSDLSRQAQILRNEGVTIGKTAGKSIGLII